MKSTKLTGIVHEGKELTPETIVEQVMGAEYYSKLHQGLGVLEGRLVLKSDPAKEPDAIIIQLVVNALGLENPTLSQLQEATERHVPQAAEAA